MFKKTWNWMISKNENFKTLKKWWQWKTEISNFQWTGGLLLWEWKYYQMHSTDSIQPPSNYNCLETIKSKIYLVAQKIANIQRNLELVS